MLTTLVLLIATALAAGADDDELAAKVRRLVAELDAATLAGREQAERDLAALGPEMLPLLPADSNRLSLEQRQRLKAVRLKVETAAARSAAAGTRVTLQASEMPLAEFFAALERQTGNKVLDHREKFGQQADDKRITVSLDNVPFWQAIDLGLRGTGLGVYHYSGEPGLAIVAQPGQADRTRGAVYRGALRFEATRIEARRDLRTPDEDALKVTLDVAWEPKALPIVLEQPLDALSAVDEHGRPIEVDRSQGGIEAGVQAGTSGTELELPFRAPPRSVQRIARLKGKLAALLPGPTAAFRFEKLAEAEPVQQRQGAVAVTLDRVQQVNEGNWQVAIRVQFDDPGRALESHRGWVYNNRAYLLAPGGQRLEGGFETIGQSETEVGVAYLFETGGGIEGYTFVYETPTAIIPSEVEFELENLPLP